MLSPYNVESIHDIAEYIDLTYVKPNWNQLKTPELEINLREIKKNNLKRKFNLIYADESCDDDDGLIREIAEFLYVENKLYEK